MPDLPPLLRRPTSLVLLLASAAAMAGCASLGSRLADEHRTPLGEPLDPLWAELTDVYRDLGLPIAEMPIREPEIRTGDVPLDDGSLSGVSGGRLVDCPPGEGEPGAGVERLAFLRVSTRLEGEAAADVITRVEAWRTTAEGRRRDCRSTGRLERRIADELRSRV